MVCIGDKVKVKFEDCLFTDYRQFIDDYASGFIGVHTRTVQENYALDSLPTERELGGLFNVEYVAVDPISALTLAIIRNCETDRVFIYYASALEVVTPVSSHKIGQKVRITNSGYTYSNWNTLIESQKGIISPDLCGKWRDNISPSTGEEGKLIWFGGHVVYPQSTTVCIIETHTGVYIIGEEGLKFAEDTEGDITWGKYLAYVRNWCTKHKDFAPGGSAGPLSRPDWEREYKAHTLVI